MDLDMSLELAKITNYDKTLLLHSINCYMEKINFVLKNSDFYNIDKIIFDDLKRDLILLKDLQLRICSIET